MPMPKQAVEARDYINSCGGAKVLAERIIEVGACDDEAWRLANRIRRWTMRGVIPAGWAGILWSVTGMQVPESIQELPAGARFPKQLFRKDPASVW